MSETIDIPILYQGEQLTFTATILSFGYTFRLSVDVNGTAVYFEPDDQGQYRAVLAVPETKVSKADREIIAEIAAVLGTKSEGGE